MQQKLHQQHHLVQDDLLLPDDSRNYIAVLRELSSSVSFPYVIFFLYPLLPCFSLLESRIRSSTKKKKFLRYSCTFRKSNLPQ